MANVAISALPAATSGAGADLAVIVQGGTTKQLTLTNLFKYLSAPQAIGDGTPGTGAFTTLSASGSVSFTQDITAGTAVVIQKNGSDTVGAGPYFNLVPVTGAPTGEWFIQLSAANNIDFWNYNSGWTKYHTISTTGLSVTGTLSATGVISSTSASGSSLLLNASGGNVSVNLKTATGTATDWFLQADGSGSKNRFHIYDNTGGGYIATFEAATGLAVTGTLSATGATTVTRSTNSASEAVGLSVADTRTGAGATGWAVKGDLISNVALGSYANGVYGILSFGANGAVTGLAAGVCSEIVMGAGCTAGTYAGLEIEVGMGTDAVCGTATSFMYLSLYGSAAATFDTNGYLFHLAGVTKNTGKLLADTTSGATIRPVQVLRVKTPDGDRYLPLYSTAAIGA